MLKGKNNGFVGTPILRNTHGPWDEHQIAGEGRQKTTLEKSQQGDGDDSDDAGDAAAAAAAAGKQLC